MQNSKGFIAAPVLIIAVIIAGLVAGGSWWYIQHTEEEAVDTNTAVLVNANVNTSVAADGNANTNTVVSVKIATYIGSWWSPCSKDWQMTFEKTGTTYQKTTQCMDGRITDSPTTIQLTKEQFDKAILAESFMADARNDYGVVDNDYSIVDKATVLQSNDPLLAKTVSCWQSSNKVNTLCADTVGVITILRQTSSKIGILDADRSQALQEYTLEPGSTNTNTSTIQNTNVSTADWKTYINTAYGYALRYPGEYTVAEASNSYHGGVTFLKDMSKDPVRNVNGFIMPDRREVTVSVIEASPLSQFAGNADYQLYYQWVRSGFTNDPPSGYYGRETIKLGSNTFTRFTVASGVDSVYEYFVRHGDTTLSFYDSVLSSSDSAHAENQKLLTTLTFAE